MIFVNKRLNLYFLTFNPIVQNLNKNFILLDEESVDKTNSSQDGLSEVNSPGNNNYFLIVYSSVLFFNMFTVKLPSKKLITTVMCIYDLLAS